MSDHAQERGRTPVASSDPEVWIAESYLLASRGDFEEAFRIAVRDVINLNHLAAQLGEGASWGFMRRPKAGVFRPTP